VALILMGMYSHPATLGSDQESTTLGQDHRRNRTQQRTRRRRRSSRIQRQSSSASLLLRKSKHDEWRVRESFTVRPVDRNSKTTRNETAERKEPAATAATGDNHQT